MDPLSISVACVGVLSAITTLGKHITTFGRDYRDSRKDLEAVQRELSSLAFCVESLHNDATTDNIPYPDSLKSHLVSVLKNCNSVMTDMTALLDNFSTKNVGKRLLWVTSGQGEMNRLRITLEAHKQTLDLALDIISIFLIASVKQDTSKILGETQTIKENTAQISDIKDNTAKLLEEISKLKAQLSQTQGLQENKAYMLQRFLDDSTTYAESVAQQDLSEKDHPSRNHAAKQKASLDAPNVSHEAVLQSQRLAVDFSPLVTPKFTSETVASTDNHPTDDFSQQQTTLPQDGRCRQRENFPVRQEPAEFRGEKDLPMNSQTNTKTDAVGLHPASEIPNLLGGEKREMVVSYSLTKQNSKTKEIQLQVDRAVFQATEAQFMLNKAKHTAYNAMTYTTLQHQRMKKSLEQLLASLAALQTSPPPVEGEQQLKKAVSSADVLLDGADKDLKHLNIAQCQELMHHATMVINGVRTVDTVYHDPLVLQAIGDLEQECGSMKRTIDLMHGKCEKLQVTRNRLKETRKLASTRCFQTGEYYPSRESSQVQEGSQNTESNNVTPKVHQRLEKQPRSNIVVQMTSVAQNRSMSAPETMKTGVPNSAQMTEQTDIANRPYLQKIVSDPAVKPVKFDQGKSSQTATPYSQNFELIDELNESLLILVNDLIGDKEDVVISRMNDLVKGGANININGGIPLRQAVAKNKSRLVRWILDNGGTEGVDDTLHQTIALSRDHDTTNIAQMLLEHGADPDSVRHQKSALAYASMREYWAIVKLLIDRGAQEGIRDAIVELAGAKDADLTLMCELLARSSKVSWDSTTWSRALRRAARYGSSEMVRLLIETETQKGIRDAIVELAGAEDADLTLMRELLARSSEVPCDSTTWSRALHKAAQYGSSEMVQLLIDKVDFLKREKQRRAGLEYALKRNAADPERDRIVALLRPKKKSLLETVFGPHEISKGRWEATQRAERAEAAKKALESKNARTSLPLRSA